MSAEAGFVSEEDLALLRRLMEARTRRDEAKTAATEAEKDYREIESEVHLKLEEGPLQRLPNIDLGEPWGKVTFHARETVYGKVVDRDAAEEYFEQRAMVDELTESKFVAQRIGEIVRHVVETNAQMPPGLGFTKKRYVQITTQKSS
jgi:hypothetical protein